MDPDVLAPTVDFPRARTGEPVGVRAALAVPLLAGPDVVGVLEFFSPEPAPVDQRLLDLVAQVGNELGGVGRASSSWRTSPSIHGGSPKRQSAHCPQRQCQGPGTGGRLLAIPSRHPDR